jgi:hypothetical protein
MLHRVTALALLISGAAFAQTPQTVANVGKPTAGAGSVQGQVGMIPVVVSCPDGTCSGGGGGGGTVTQGPAGTNAAGWWVRVGDGTNGPAAVKAASTAADASDKALVVAVSPNNVVTTQPVGSTTTGYFNAIAANTDGAAIDNRMRQNTAHRLFITIGGSGSGNFRVRGQFSADGTTNWTDTGQWSQNYFNTGDAYLYTAFGAWPFFRWIVDNGSFSSITMTGIAAETTEAPLAVTSGATTFFPQGIVAIGGKNVPFAESANGVVIVTPGYNQAGNIPFGASISALDGTSDVLMISDESGTFAQGAVTGVLRNTAATMTLVAEVRNRGSGTGGPWEIVPIKKAAGDAFSASISFVADSSDYNLFFDFTSVPGVTNLRLRASAYTSGSAQPVLTTTNLPSPDVSIANTEGLTKLATANTGRLQVDVVTSPSITVTQATASNLNAQVVGSIASGGSNAGNPVKIGHVFNTTQPTVTNGQIVDVQATARGAAIVATGSDTFNVTVNAALPAGANVIGHVIADSGSTTVVTGTVAVTLPTTSSASTTGTCTSVSTSTTILAANAARKGGIITALSSNANRARYAFAASATASQMPLEAGQSLPLDSTYTGAISFITDSGGATITVCAVEF